MPKNVLMIDGGPTHEILQEILSPDNPIPVAVEDDSYAIIGTRDPDENQREAARTLAFLIACLRRKKVRTGAAYGIDEAAMVGTQGTNLDVYLPWATYNRDIVPPGSRVVVYSPAEHAEWTASVAQYHPAAGRLSRGAFALHARNYGIVAGAKTVIAFPDPKGGGGTAQGIRIARGLKIPVIQADKGTISDLPRWLGKTLQTLGFADKNIATTLLGERK